MNARFTALTQCEPECEEVKDTYANFFGGKQSVEQSLGFKYQVLVDGNGPAYSRARWMLFSNSLVFKQDSNATQVRAPKELRSHMRENERREGKEGGKEGGKR